jgi:hypothetical protein
LPPIGGVEDIMRLRAVALVLVGALSPSLAQAQPQDVALLESVQKLAICG